jgi:hypothetical protein
MAKRSQVPDFLDMKPKADKIRKDDTELLEKIKALIREHKADPLYKEYKKL